MHRYNQVRHLLEYLSCVRPFTLRKLGTLNNTYEFPFYVAVFNDKPQLPTIVYSVGIHGNEPAPVDVALRFLKDFDPAKFPQFRIIVFPVVNPTGYNARRRYNYQGLDLNACFQRKNLPPECRFMLEMLRNIENIRFFGAFHEDLYTDKYYLFKFEYQTEPFYDDLLKAANRFLPSVPFLDTGEGIAYNGFITNSFDRSIESRMFSERGCFSICSETPGRVPFENRVLCNLALMQAVPEILKGMLK